MKDKEVKKKIKKEKIETDTLCFFKNPLFSKDKIEIFKYDIKKNVMQLIYKK